MNKIAVLFLFLSIVIISCNKDDYRVGGNIHNPNINMTTYDYLASNKYGLFDTLLMLIDKAGVKDKINQSGVTFFAPTDYAIKNYVENRTIKIQRIDPLKKWTVDSIIKYELPVFADSLDIYLIKDHLPNNRLTAQGAVYQNLKNGNVALSYEETSDAQMGANDNSSILPKVVYFTYLYQNLPSNVKISDVAWPIGVRTLVQTSNAQTTTGALHVLNNSHTLFFFR